MEVLMTVLYALVIVVALLLGLLILIQPSKSGGLGTTFGGVGESVFGARAGSHLTKATVVLTVIFFVLVLVLAALIGHLRSKSLVLDSAIPEKTVQQTAPEGKQSADAAKPAAPAAAKPAAPATAKPAAPADVKPAAPAAAKPAAPADVKPAAPATAKPAAPATPPAK